MTRSNAREVAVHLIYELDYTAQTPEEALETRMEKGYYSGLAEENEVYTERPSKKTAGVYPYLRGGRGCPRG